MKLLKQSPKQPKQGKPKVRKNHNPLRPVETPVSTTIWHLAVMAAILILAGAALDNPDDATILIPVLIMQAMAGTLRETIRKVWDRTDEHGNYVYRYGRPDRREFDQALAQVFIKRFAFTVVMFAVLHWRTHDTLHALVLGCAFAVLKALGIDLLLYYVIKPRVEMLRLKLIRKWRAIWRAPFLRLMKWLS